MADATVIVYRYTGAGPDEDAITAIVNRMSDADDDAPGLSDPISIPVAGNNRAYLLIMRAKMTVENQGVKNLQWCTDGVNNWLADLGGDAGACTVRVATSDVYHQPFENELTNANYGNDLDELEPGVYVKNAFDIGAGNPINIGSGPFPLNGYSKYVIVQVTLTDTAEVALVNPERFRWRWNHVT